MSLPGRFFGVLFKPAGTFRLLAEHPIWLDALVFVLLAGAVFSYLIFPYAQKDRLLTFEDKAAAFIEAHGEQQYAAAAARIKNESRALASFVISPLMMLTGGLFASLIALGLGRAVTHRGHYLQVFSCFIHAGFVSTILGNAVRLALVLARQSTLHAATGLPAFFPGLAPGSTAYAALSQVDFFSLWMYGLLAAGLTAAFKVSVRKGLAISYALWLLRGLGGFALAVIESKFFL